MSVLYLFMLAAYQREVRAVHRMRALRPALEPLTLLQSFLELVPLVVVVIVVSCRLIARLVLRRGTMRRRLVRAAFI